MLRKTLALAALAASFTLGGASAQLSGGGANAPAAAAALGEFENATTSFDGVKVQVVRLVKEPDAENDVRLILRLTNTAKEERRLLFVTPATRLIDEMGNEYIGRAATGVRICMSNQVWDASLDDCRRYHSSYATRLAPDVPVTASMIFTPASSGFAKELADLSETVSLHSRIGFFSPDFSKASPADVIVNGIPFPR